MTAASVVPLKTIGTAASTASSSSIQRMAAISPDRAAETRSAVAVESVTGKAMGLARGSSEARARLAGSRITAANTVPLPAVAVRWVVVNTL